MARNDTHEELRDEEIARLTKQNFSARMAMLRTGDPVVRAAVASSVAAEFNDDKLMDELVELAARGAIPCGVRFQQLVEKVVRNEAEVDALAEVEKQDSYIERALDRITN